ADNYFDPTFGGVDWPRVRQKYEGKISSLTSDDEFYALVNSMLSELGRSHLSMIPREAFQDPKLIANGGTGVDTLFIDEQALITRVDAGSAAERAGIKQGFVIKEVD